MYAVAPHVCNYRWALVAAITVLAGVAAAHVAPSVDDNNRYLKLTPLGDRVRLAYTVFYGENPGRVARRSIDTDRDGAISDAEARAFATQLAGEVGRAVEVTVDGAVQPVHWAEIIPGMGAPDGAFSVDLVAWLCLPSVRGAHRVQLRDQFRLPRAGETEIRVEDSPGVTIERAHVGRDDMAEHIYKFIGPGGALSDEGLDLAFTAGDRAAVMTDGACTGVAAPEGSHLSVGVAVGLGVLVVGGLAFVLLRRNRAS